MLNSPEMLPAAPDREPDIDDQFNAGASSERWFASYLPQWTTSERARAHYEVVTNGIELRIDSDQPDWRLEDAPLRVSNLQTGVYSGPVGSALGTHRHRVDLDVRTETSLKLLFAPSHGRVEITVSASQDANCMVAAWLVGTEHRSPAESGEICIFEIDADAGLMDSRSGMDIGMPIDGERLLVVRVGSCGTTRCLPLDDCQALLDFPDRIEHLASRQL